MPAVLVAASAVVGPVAVVAAAVVSFPSPAPPTCDPVPLAS